LSILRDPCGTFCPQGSAVGYPQDRPRPGPFEHSVCHADQPANVGARVVIRHQARCMAEQSGTIFSAHARCSKSRAERVTKIVNPDLRKQDSFSRALPRSVVHRLDPPAVVRKDEVRVIPLLFVHDRPSDIVENHHVRSSCLERLRRDDEHAAVDKLGRTRFLEK
jgi:hypothetical protein